MYVHVILSIVSAILVIIAAITFWRALRMRKHAIERTQTLAWSRLQLKRASTLLGSTSVDEVLSGLQIVRALGVGLDDQTLTRVAQLTEHEDPRVASQAHSALLSTTRRVQATRTLS